MEQAGSSPTAKLDTPIGPIFVSANGMKTAIVSAPQVMVDGAAMSVTAVLTSSDGLNFDFIRQFVRDERSGPPGLPYAQHALRATLASGQEADLIALGKVAAIIAPAVRQFAAAQPKFFLEAERRALLGYIAGLEATITHDQQRVAEKRRELAKIEAQLVPPR
jgi:hypothetical protein